MDTVTEPMYEWKDINWRKVERCVFKLQKRIFRASQQGDVKLVHRLQRLLQTSWSAKALAVRRVTQDNLGKKTAGVDGVKSLSPAARLKLTGKLNLGTKVKPTRRVWIPKPGTDEKRPLGIPTMYDRALQALVKLALEPEWEAKFEPNSYGFRPGRSAHDAIGAIYNSINKKPKYVLDADISKCFDKINQEKLLAKLQTYPKLRRQVKAWLKAGVMDGKTLFPTDEGTPQGGVISPLLANIALHGMEERIKQYAETLKGNKSKNKQALALIRYADDFVIMHPEQEVIAKSQEVIKEWLAQMGLELKPSKTRVTHTLEEHNGNVGFDFLGFNIRQYTVGKNQCGTNTQGKKLGFKTLIKPSAEKIKTHTKKIRKVVDKHKGSPQLALINRLNPIIRGWCNYYSTVVSKEAFEQCYSNLVQKLLRWAYRRHPMKSRTWIVRRYWHTEGNRNWVFSTREGKNPFKLTQHQDTKIARYVKVKGNRSPYDGDTVYWSSRLGKHPEMPNEKSYLLKKQNGKCAYCGLTFHDGDYIETDHIIPKSQGGKNIKSNKQLLHRHCHDLKTAQDLTGTHDKSHVNRGAE